MERLESHQLLDAYMDAELSIEPTFRTLTVHYLRLATGRVSEGELLARTVDGGLYREQLKYLRLNRC